jgi:hypothetical protein
MSSHTFALLDRAPIVGDWTIRDGYYVRVVAIVDHPAGHASPTVRTDMPAREWRTDDGGSRWSGIRPDGTAHHTPNAYRRG